MTVEEIAQSYYEAWQNKGGDFSDVPLAEDFEFTGPVASLRARMGTGKWPRRRARP
jgi:ketosteroid isomerase-like protein